MTITKLALAILLAAATAFPCQAAPSPEEIIDAFFGPNPGSNRADSYTGEMKERYSDEPTIGQMLPPGKHYSVRRLSLSTIDAPVYGVAINDGAIDWYAYFTREDGTLKLKALRSLGVSSHTFDAIVLAEKHTRTDQEEWDYRSLRIAFLPDVERLAHFRKLLGELDALKVAIEANDGDATRARMHALHFKDWNRNALGQLEIQLGGPLDSVVGVLYVPPGERPPPIDETDHIYIEQIEGSWYVYKTT